MGFYIQLAMSDAFPTTPLGLTIASSSPVVGHDFSTIEKLVMSDVFFAFQAKFIAHRVICSSFGMVTGDEQCSIFMTVGYHHLLRVVSLGLEGN